MVEAAKAVLARRVAGQVVEGGAAEHGDEAQAVERQRCGFPRPGAATGNEGQQAAAEDGQGQADEVDGRIGQPFLTRIGLELARQASRWVGSCRGGGVRAAQGSILVIFWPATETSAIRPEVL